MSGCLRNCRPDNPVYASIPYQVRKDNTVPIKGNRYTVPRGTYKGPYTYVRVNYTGDNELEILELDTDKRLGHFKIPVDKGNLVKNNDHRRDKSGKISALIDELADRFTDPDKAKNFIEAIHTEKPRYIRDQILLIQKSVKGTSLEVVDKALEFCVKNGLYRATDFQDAVNHYQKDKQVSTDTFTVKVSSMSAESLEKIRVTPKIRDMSEYISALGAFL